MQYISYEEYINYGGICDLTAFNHYIYRVCRIIDNYTQKRIRNMKSIPMEVKQLCKELIDYFSENMPYNSKIITNKSQTAGNVSESESYYIKDDEKINAETTNIICDYLLYVNDDNGTPLLYRGVTI